MQYTKTTFQNGTAPYLSAEELNKIGSMLETLAGASLETCTFDGVNSTQALYKLTTEANAPGQSEAKPRIYTFIPSIRNSAEAKCQPTWSNSALDIYDTTTGEEVLGGAIQANVPCLMYYDGARMWINGDGGGAFRLTPDDVNGHFEPGTFSRTNIQPDGVTKLSYNGYFYANKLTANDFNSPAECAALGYDITGVNANNVNSAIGSLVAVNGSNEFIINNTANNQKTVGIITDSYMSLGGEEYGETPVAYSGRVQAKVHGACEAGDYLVASSTDGCLEVADFTVDDTSIVAQALEDKEDTDTDLVLVQLMNAPFKGGWDTTGTFRITSGTHGTFSRTENDPTDTDRLEYNGYLYATKLAATDGFENPSGNNVAYGYPISAEVEAGDVIAVSSSGTFAINSTKNSPNIVGVVSDDYAALYGTEFGNKPVVTSGRVHAKVKGSCSVGDFLVSSDTAGYLEVKDSTSQRWNIVAQALEDKVEPEETEGEEVQVVEDSDLVLVRLTFMSLYNGSVHINPNANNVAEMYAITVGEGEDDPEAGDLIAMDTDGDFVVNEIYNTNTPIGIVSDDYAALYGSATDGIPVATFGRIQAKVKGGCERGDYLVGSSVRGCLEVADVDAPRGSIIAMALGHKDAVESEDPTDDIDKVLVRIVNL